MYELTETEQAELTKNVHKYQQDWWTQEEERLPEVKELIKYAGPKAFFKKHAYSTKFHSIDSKQQWNKNLEEKKEALEKYGWLKPENAITYEFNSKGFRDEEFTDYDDCWVAIGECFTFGTGLHRELTWVHKLEQKMQTKIWNLAQCSTGTDTVFRGLLANLEDLKPSKVLILEPPPIAREVFVDHPEHPGMPEWIGSWRQEDWMKSLAENKVERYITRMKNYHAMESFVRSSGAEFHFIQSEERHQIALDSWDEVNTGEFAIARDLMHPGWHFQQKMFERWFKELDKGQQ
mgnify:FL=1